MNKGGILFTQMDSLGNVISRAPSTSALARRAGISRTTVLQLQNDRSRARVSTIRELVLALGYDVTIDVQPASDPLAAAAARFLLGDLAASAEFDDWVTRLKRYRPDNDPLGIVDEAASVSAPQHRDGSVMFAGRSDPDRLVSVGIATGSRWALSGGAALEALGSDGGTVVMWTEDVKQVAQLLAETHRRVNIVNAAQVIAAPAHWTVFDGSGALADVVLVSPVQAVIDSFGIGGQTRAQAVRVAGQW